MPHPLSALTQNEHRLYGDLAADPLAADMPLILSGIAEDQGQDQRADLLRHQTRLPLLELLRGQALTETDCRQLTTRIRTLLASPAAKPHTDPERELSTALGSPKRGEAMLQLLDKDGTLDLQRLCEQYDFQVTLLASLDLLEEHDGHLGITGIDHHFHPLPSFEAIRSRLQSPTLRHKIAQGFDQLLLVPFALPLERLIEAWKRDLLRNEQLLAPHGGLSREHPLWMSDGYSQEDVVYFPQRFATDHGGRTKAQLLDSDPEAAWQVLLTEGALTDIPRAGQGHTIAGRRQIEAGRTPHQYLADFPKDEVGWTPETYIAAFCTGLEQTGSVLDAKTASYLTALYVPDTSYVPFAYWHPRGRAALFGRGHPDFHYPRNGARAAVPVV
jgi:hypothetical protein